MPEEIEQVPLDDVQPEIENESAPQAVNPLELELKKVRAEAKERRLEAKALRDELAALKAAPAAEDTAAEALKQVNELKAQLAARELETKRLRIAAQTGLPAALVDRLRGETDEDIRKDAQTLLGVVKPNSPGTTSPSNATGNPAGSAAKLTWAELQSRRRRDLF